MDTSRILENFHQQEKITEIKQQKFGIVFLILFYQLITYTSWHYNLVQISNVEKEGSMPSQKLLRLRAGILRFQCVLQLKLNCRLFVIWRCNKKSQISPSRNLHTLPCGGFGCLRRCQWAYQYSAKCSANDVDGILIIFSYTYLYNTHIIL